MSTVNPALIDGYVRYFAARGIRVLPAEVDMMVKLVTTLSAAIDLPVAVYVGDVPNVVRLAADPRESTVGVSDYRTVMHATIQRALQAGVPHRA